MEIKGVITGDIIGSTSFAMAERAEMLDCIAKTLDEIGQAHTLRYEFFRGDGVQIVVDEATEALLVGVLLRAGLRRRKESWDIRLSVGVGKVEYMAGDVRVSDGEAFRLSGRELDKMGRSSLSVATPWREVNDEFAVSIAFADDVMCGWTSGQANAMYITLLKGVAKKDVAQLTGQTPQNVSRLLLLARLKPMRGLIERFRSVMATKTELS